MKVSEDDARGSRAAPSAAALERVGPYRLIGSLGEGGMGVVWRARREATGDVVALKTVPVAGVASIHAIRREIAALRRIRHPGIVRILDDGVKDGLPWYAMDLLEGRTLREMLDRPGAKPAAVARGTTQLDTERTAEMSDAAIQRAHEVLDGRRPAGSPPPLQDTLPIFLGVCEALSHLHERGLVHRDLKPENVMVREDGSPVLFDLGIAAAFAGAEGREEIDVAGLVIGSLPYMAPEQIRGELADARADLYALGCMLYECLTGLPPFDVMSPSLLVHAHLFDVPPPPSSRVDGIPEALDALVLRLLEKRPRDRIGYADDVAFALRSFVSRSVVSGAPPASAGVGEGSRAPSPAYVYRAGFNGRDEILARFASALDRLSVFQGGRCLVAGESGAGKTRLLLEVSRMAVRRRVTVLSAQCEPLGSTGGPSLGVVQPLLTAMIDRCRSVGPEEAARVFGPRGRLLALYEPLLLSLPGVAREPEPAPLPAEAARARVLRALVECIRAHTSRTPHLLLADDLQWADDLSLALLESLGHPETAVPGLLVVGAYRAEEVNPVLLAMTASSDVDHVPLSRLGEPAVRGIVGDMLALPDPPARLVSFLTEVSSGNPFFLGEYLRSAIGEGLLTRDLSGAWQLDPATARIADIVPFPQRLSDLVDRRLASLGSAVRPIAEAASVLGREMDASLLSAVAGADDAESLEAIEGLRVRQVLEEPRPGALGFVHDKLREVAYSKIEPARRLELHRRAAAAILARQGDGPEVAATLGHHLSRSEQPAQAARMFERAADHARARYANEEAIGHFRAAIEQANGALPRSPRGASGGDARPLSPVGGSPRAAGNTLPEEAGKVLPDQVLPDEMLPDRMLPDEMLPGLGEKLGDVLALVGRHEEARAAFEGAILDLGEGSPEGGRVLPRVQRARLWRKAGKTLEVVHRHDAAFEAYERAERVLGAPPSEHESEWWDEWLGAHADRVYVHYWRGELAALEDRIDRIRPVVEQHGTPYQLIWFFRTLLLMGVRAESFRPTASTLQHGREHLAAAERGGSPEIVLDARCTLGVALCLAGELDEAEELLRAAYEVAKAAGNVGLVARCLIYLSVVLRRTGRREELRRMVGELTEASHGAQAGEYVGAALAQRAWIALGDGDLEEAGSLASSAVREWFQQGYVYPLQWLALVILFALHFEADRADEVIACATQLIDPGQQSIAPVTARIEEGLQASRSGDSAAARTAWESALATARAAGYL